MNAKSLEQNLAEALIQSGYSDSINVVVSCFRVSAGYGIPTTMEMVLTITDSAVLTAQEKWAISQRGKI